MMFGRMLRRSLWRRGFRRWPEVMWAWPSVTERNRKRRSRPAMAFDPRPPRKVDRSAASPRGDSTSREHRQTQSSAAAGIKPAKFRSVQNRAAVQILRRPAAEANTRVLLLQQRLDEMSVKYETLMMHTAEREREKIKYEKMLQRFWSN